MIFQDGMVNILVRFIQCFFFFSIFDFIYVYKPHHFTDLFFFERQHHTHT